MKIGRRVSWVTTVSLLLALALIAAACGGGGDGGPITEEEAKERLQSLVDDIGWRNDPVTRTANVPPPGTVDLADTLPAIDEFPIVVSARGSNQVVAEIFVSTEKSGEGTDGWMVDVAEAFNKEGLALSDGREARVEIRKIASGTGYQYIAAGQSLPAGFSPSNHRGSKWPRPIER